MAVSLKHAFTSNVADSGDPNLVQPSNWNAEHTLTAGADTLLGAISAGSVVEIPCTAAGRAILDDADAAAQRTTLGLGTGDSPTFTGLTLSGVGSFSAGTALLPSLTTTGDTNTGMWFPAADTIAWSTAGAERIRIRSDGNIGVASAGNANRLFLLAKSFTGATTMSGFQLSSSIASDVTSDVNGFATFLATNAASFTITSVAHFNAIQSTFGAGSAVTLQYGFASSSANIGATNNYAFGALNTAAVTSGKTAFGFHSAINIATGGGTTWAFYGAGTAPSYFAGQVQLGAGSVGTPSLSAFGDTNTGIWFPAADTIAFSEGGVEVARINSSAQFLIGGTTADAKLTVTGVGTTSTTPSTTTDIGATLGIRSTGAAGGDGGMLMFGAFFGYFGAIKGFLQNGSGPLGAIDFYTRNGTSDTTLTQRMRIDSSGNVGIGSSTLTSTSFRVSKNLTGSTAPSGVFSDGTIQSDGTGVPTYFSGLLNTAAATFTIGNAQIYRAAVGTIGAGSAITNLYGYSAAALTAGTTNYGFFASAPAANVTTGKTYYGFFEASSVATGGGTSWAFYASGTAPNYFAGQVQLGAGAVGTPSLAAFGDTNTGMWFPAADTIAVSTGGTEALRVNSSQQLLVGGTSADAKLTVTGVGTTSTTPSTTTDIGATLGIRSSGAGAGNGGMLMFGSSAGYFGAIKGFLQNGSGPLGAIDFYTRNGSADATLTQRMRINFNGNIGIGTGSPDALLSVNGIASFGAGAVGTPSITAFGDLNTGMWFPAADTIAWSTGGSERMRADANGNVVVSTAAIATTATNGFLYVPSCAGTPTGTPTTYTGRVPIVVDTTNNKLYFYSGGAWRDAGP